MSANHHTRRSPGWWRAVCRATRALRRLHDEQVYAWEVWSQANRAAVPEDGPLRWARTLDGYRLAGGYASAGSDTSAGGTA
jgi:hypothetical protein